jgi:hypothetical protein
LTSTRRASVSTITVRPKTPTSGTTSGARLAVQGAPLEGPAHLDLPHQARLDDQLTDRARRGPGATKVVGEAEACAQRLRAVRALVRRSFRARRIPMTATWRSMPAPAAPSRTGPACCCGCTRWSEQHGFKVDWIEETGGEGGGHPSATIRSRAQRYGWLKTGAACIAWCASRRSTRRAPAHLVR